MISTLNRIHETLVLALVYGWCLYHLARKLFHE
jgi:hypothetical protein